MGLCEVNSCIDKNWGLIETHPCSKRYTQSSLKSTAYNIFEKAVAKKDTDNNFFIIGQGLIYSPDLIEKYSTFHCNKGKKGKNDKADGAIFAQAPYSVILNDVWIMAGIEAGLTFYLKGELKKEPSTLEGTIRELALLILFGYERDPKSDFDDLKAFKPCKEKNKGIEGGSRYEHLIKNDKESIAALMAKINALNLS